MEYSCENYLMGANGKKFFTGDKVVVRTDGSCFNGVKITIITSKGIYFNAGTKSDKYIRADNIKEIKLIEE